MNCLIELLAPVGSKDSLVAAVEARADAVYLAGKMFGARAYAANFSDEELAEAIIFAHKRNVLVYVAVNTIVDNGEFAELVEYLRFLYEAGADAIIVQDLGVAKLAREVVPRLPLHASTQMTVHNLEGVKAMRKIGFTRVVLARELSMADIQYICKHSELEIEVFVHGALCISYSGQCLMSGMIGGRSGNRGRCAQPCRLPYMLVDEAGNDVLKGQDCGAYLLSPKDMNTVELLPEFIEAGVASLKIEGRMKRPEYVAVVVDTYRRAIESYEVGAFYVQPSDQKNLAQIFNRDFTTAYLQDRPGKRMMSDRRPNNRGVLAGRVLRYDAKTKIAVIKLAESLSVNDILEFWVKVGGRVSATVNTMTVKGDVVSEAQPGEEATIELPVPVRDNDRVFKVFDAPLMEKARRFFNSGAPIRRILLDVHVDVGVGRPFSIEVKDEDGFLGRASSEFIAEKALKRPLTEENVLRQIDRLGTSIFSLREFQCDLQGEVMVPVSEINETRRKAVEMAEAARLAQFDRQPLQKRSNEVLKQYFRGSKNLSPAKPALSVNVDTVEKVEAALTRGADIILFGGESYSHAPITLESYRRVYEMVKQCHRKIIFTTPRLLQRWQMEEFKQLLAAFQTFDLDAVAVQNVSTIDLVKEFLDVPIHADLYMNVYNHLTIALLADLGISSVSLSPELNFSQIERLMNFSALPVECVVHGNLELMISEYCTLGSYLGGLGKGKCSQPCTRKQYWLLDRKDEKFPLVTDQYCRMHVLNGKELSMLGNVARFGQNGINRIRIEGKFADKNRVGALTGLYRELLDLGQNHPLLTEDKLQEVEGGNVTRGHYFRGVL